MAFVRRPGAAPLGRGRRAATRRWCYVEQAFGRVTPFDGRELFITGGKFDRCSGSSTSRTRRTTERGSRPRCSRATRPGPRWGSRRSTASRSARSGRRSASTSPRPTAGTSSRRCSRSTRASPAARVGSARFGYELDLPRLQIKAGASGLRGPRNDQFDREALLTMFGFDLRITFAGLSLSRRIRHVDEDEGSGRQADGRGRVSGRFRILRARLLDAGRLRVRDPARASSCIVTPYGRYEQRRAGFEGFRRHHGRTRDRGTAPRPMGVL